MLVYATFRGFPEHEQAAELLQTVKESDFGYCLTWVNVFEYLRTSTHRGMLRPAPIRLEDALRNVRALLARPSVTRIDAGPGHLETFAEVCREAGAVEGNFVHDCRIAAIMRENGVTRILTRDTMFRRIPGIEVVDPFL